MRTHFAFVTTLLLGVSVVACGAVDDGICPGEQSDNIDCTVDICNGEGGAWAHVPDNSLCTDGLRCDPTAGCVSGVAGEISGTAMLFGHTDHSGIAVTLEGTMLTATTDAMGKWRIDGVPSGVYSISYAKAEYVTQTENDINVVPESLAGARPVTLYHGHELIPDIASAVNNGVLYSPNKAYMVRFVNTGSEYIAYSEPTDGSHEPVPLATVSPGTTLVTNTHLVWSTGSGQAFLFKPTFVWSRKLDGSGGPILLASTASDADVIARCAGAYTIIQRTKTAGIFGPVEYSYWIAKTDGSVAPNATPVWIQPNTSYFPGWVACNDNHALVAINGPTGDTSPLHRFDLANNVDAPLNIGFGAQDNSLHSTSPDGTAVFASVYQNTGSALWHRGYIAPISATPLNSPPTLAPSYAAPQGGGTQYSDYPSPVFGWSADSTSVVFTAASYTNSGGTTTGGELKYWLRGQATATTVMGAGHSFRSIAGNVVVYLDNLAFTLKVASLHSATPTIQTLDNIGFFGLMDGTPWINVKANEAYIVWAPSAFLSTFPPYVKSATVPLPFTAMNANVVQLGDAPPNGCYFSAALSNTTFYRLCGDTKTLNSYTKGVMTAAGTQTDVVRIAAALEEGDAVAFVKSDGKLYAAPNTGTFGGSVKPISNLATGDPVLASFGQQVILRDVDGATRASRVDGSVIDEPLFNCDGFYSLPIWNGTAKTAIWFPLARCDNELHSFSVPVTNVPGGIQ